MVRAITFLRDLQVAGALPRGFATLGTEDVNTWMQTGRAAMAITSMGRHNIYNDPAKSKYPGKIKVGADPDRREFAREVRRRAGEGRVLGDGDSEELAEQEARLEPDPRDGVASRRR